MGESVARIAMADAATDDLLIALIGLNGPCGPDRRLDLRNRQSRAATAGNRDSANQHHQRIHVKPRNYS